MSKSIYIISMSFLVAIFIVGSIIGAYASYKFERDFTSNWNLADRASTISLKSVYVHKVVTSLEDNRDKFADNNAIIFKTNQNSFNYNLDMLKSLDQRLSDISKMNESDFAYQTAIQQITAQEQGEAGPMLEVFTGCYYLKSYPYLWGWISNLIALFILAIMGILSYVYFKSKGAFN